MTVKKRGLSRGLEALLKAGTTEGENQTLKASPVEQDAETAFEQSSSQEHGHSADLSRTGKNSSVAVSGIPLRLPIQEFERKASAVMGDTGTQSELVLALFEHIRKENLMLLEEAEALKRLIEEFELMVGRL